MARAKSQVLESKAVTICGNRLKGVEKEWWQNERITRDVTEKYGDKNLT
jgi:hypothetical protein